MSATAAPPVPDGRRSLEGKDSARPGMRARRRNLIRSAVEIAALLFLPPLASAGAAGTVDDAASVVTLREGWSFRVGDSPEWSQPELATGLWQPVVFPVGWSPDLGAGDFVWYRATLAVASSVVGFDDLPLAIRMSPVNSAYEIFANGERLGGVGTIGASPRESRLDYDTRGLFVVPKRFLTPGGSLVVALRVWRDPQTLATVGGPFEGVPEVGRFDYLLKREMLARVLGLVLALFFAALGVFHLELYRRTRRDRSFLWLGGLAIGLGAYTLLRTPWKSFLQLEFESAKDLEHVVAFLLIPAFIEFVWRLLEVPVSPFVRAYQWANVCVAVLASLPGLALNFRLLPVWQGAMIAALGAGAYKVSRRALEGLPEARIMLPGYIAVAAAITNDVLVDRGIYFAARLTPLGFAALLSSFAASISNRLLRSDSDLEELHRGLERRVIERTAELVAANEAKSRFLAVMSHEIRTPLNAVLGANRVLLERSLGPDERALCEGAERSGQALLSLIDDVLDFSRIESNKLDLALEAFDLEVICEEAFDITSPRAAEKGLDCAVFVDPALPSLVIGDAVRLRQILVNLLSNAVKFTSGGWVLFEVSAAENAASGTIQFRVSDSGVGIEAENLEVVFDRFRQVDSSNSRRYAGVGLGLAICRALAEQMRGSITVASRPGVGSTFELLLPLPASTAADPGLVHWAAGRSLLVTGLPQATRKCLVRSLELAGAKVKVADEERVSSPLHYDAEIEWSPPADKSGAGGSLRTPPLRLRILPVGRVDEALSPAGDEPSWSTLPMPARPSELRRRLCKAWGLESRVGGRPRSASSQVRDLSRMLLRVLVADDDEMGRRVTCAMLQNIGVASEVAVDGVEALQKIGASSFDLAFLDLQMPGLDGLEVARRAKESLGAACPWLVALSANVVASDRQACIAAGMERFVAKPVRPESLLAVVRELEEFRRSGVAVQREPAP